MGKQLTSVSCLLLQHYLSVSTCALVLWYPVRGVDCNTLFWKSGALFHGDRERGRAILVRCVIGRASLKTRPQFCVAWFFHYWSLSSKRPNTRQRMPLPTLVAVARPSPRKYKLTMRGTMSRVVVLLSCTLSMSGATNTCAPVKAVRMRTTFLLEIGSYYQL